MNAVLSLICRMAVFMICAQTIIHFRPDRSYEKYLRLLAGMMVMVQLVLAWGQLFRSGGAGGFEEQIQQYADRMSEEMEWSLGGGFAKENDIIGEVERMREDLYETTESSQEEAYDGGGSQHDSGRNEIEIEIEINVKPDEKTRGDNYGKME